MTLDVVVDNELLDGCSVQRFRNEKEKESKMPGIYLMEAFMCRV